MLVWKSNGEALSFLQGGGGGHPVICVAFSPSAKFLAAAAADGTVVVWKVLKKNDATEAKADAAEPEWSFEEVRVYRHCSDAQEAGSGGAGAMKGKEILSFRQSCAAGGSVQFDGESRGSECEVAQA